MRLNRRLLLESVIVSAFLIIVFIIWQIVQGYMMTKKTLESMNGITIGATDNLPSEVTFGMTNSVDWTVFLGCFLLMGIVYYGVRTVIGSTGK